MTDIFGSGDCTTGMAVRLRSVSNNMLGSGDCTTEMAVTLSHPMVSTFADGSAEMTSEMVAGLVSVFAGNSPKRLIVHSPQARCIVK